MLLEFLKKELQTFEDERDQQARQKNYIPKQLCEKLANIVTDEGLISLLKIPPSRRPYLTKADNPLQTIWHLLVDLMRSSQALLLRISSPTSTSVMMMTRRRRIWMISYVSLVLILLWHMPFRSQTRKRVIMRVLGSLFRCLRDHTGGCIVLRHNMPS